MNVASVTEVWFKNGTGWGAAPGPLAWQDAATPTALVNEAEKQLGAPGSGPVPGPSTTWQIAHAVVMLPAFRWDGVYGGNPVCGASYQVVGCAPAAEWQVEHAVGATPPSKRIVPGVPWHVWQNARSALAVKPWKDGPGITQVPPTGCGTPVAWQRVLLKHPGGVPPGAGGEGGGIGEFAPSVWQKAHTDAFPSAVLVWT